MEFGLYANTHGQSYRDDTNMFLSHTPVEEMQPVRVAQAAEKAGIHSVWYPDHVCMPAESDSEHTANKSGARAYQTRHNMLDAAVVMGAVAVQTTTLKLGTSVLISPYRHPLSDARQFMTVDHLSNGRVMLGVGVGWMAEEYDAVGISYEERNKRTEECIETYKASWTGELSSFDGKFYNFKNISMDPKTVQKPHPPIVFGGNTPLGARRAGRFCDGFYPLFLDSHVDFHRYVEHQDIIRRELDKKGRPVSDFMMLCAAGARITDAGDPMSEAKPRRTCTGTAEQILEDFSELAAAGFSMAVCMIECPSGEVSEQLEQIQRLGEEVIPEVKKLKPAGEWKLVT